MADMKSVGCCSCTCLGFEESTGWPSSLRIRWRTSDDSTFADMRLQINVVTALTE